MGREVAPIVAARFGRCILELGGNNAMIVTPSANLEMAAEAIVFAAVGTAGQRCTSLRRVTATINYSDSMPLAQGVRFGVDSDENSQGDQT